MSPSPLVLFSLGRIFISLFLSFFLSLCLFCKRIKCCITMLQHTHKKIEVSLRQYTHHVRGCAHGSVHGTSNSILTDRYFFYYAVITHENRTTVFKVQMQTKRYLLEEKLVRDAFFMHFVFVTT